MIRKNVISFVVLKKSQKLLRFILQIRFYNIFLWWSLCQACEMNEYCLRHCYFLLKDYSIPWWKLCQTCKIGEGFVRHYQSHLLDFRLMRIVSGRTVVAGTVMAWRRDYRCGGGTPPAAPYLTCLHTVSFPRTSQWPHLHSIPFTPHAIITLHLYFLPIATSSSILVPQGPSLSLGSLLYIRL